MLKNTDVILISSCNYTLHTKNVLNAQIIADELANAGNRVLFVESLGLKTVPTFGKTDRYKVVKRLFDFIKLVIGGVIKPRSNIFVLPLVRLPFENHRVIKRINELLITYFIKRYSKKYLSPNPILWIFLPTGQFLIDTVKHSVSIYHCVDDYSEVPNVDKSYVLAQQDLILKKSDLIITVSPVTAKEFKEKTDEKKVYYLNNVARFEFFNQSLTKKYKVPEDMEVIVKTGKPIVGFMGNLASYKENLELLAQVAHDTPQYNYVFIGPIGAGEAYTNVLPLQELSNVYLLGPKDYDQLPRYFKYFDVAVIARRRNKANEGGFPLKYFEYLSSGLPVVVTGIESIKEFSRNTNLGSIADNKKDFIFALTYWIDMKRKNRQQCDKRLKVRLSIARENSWEKRIKDFDRIISQYL